MEWSGNELLASSFFSVEKTPGKWFTIYTTHYWHLTNSWISSSKQLKLVVLHAHPFNPTKNGNYIQPFHRINNDNKLNEIVLQIDELYK